MFDREAASVNVGERIRELREGRGISIRSLSRLSGLSANALSMIERSLASPSVSTLYKLCDALQVPVTAVFRTEPQREAIVFRKAEERTRVPFPLGVWEGLGGEAFIGRVQPFMLTLESGANSGQDTIVHTGHEFVLCLRGSLEYEVEGKHYLLNAGDSLLFAARVQHRWRNPGDVVASALILLSGFEEYESPVEFHFSPPSR